MIFGLLGRHLPHSYSPAIHACFGNYPYSLFEVEPSQLEDFLTSHSFDGLNVTSPTKKMSYLICPPFHRKQSGWVPLIQSSGKTVC